MISEESKPLPSVTVVLLSFNSKPLLEELIHKLQLYTPISEQVKLLIADNCSTDGSVEYLRSNHPDIPTVEFRKNYGFAEGFNKAVGSVHTDHVVLLSCDVEVTEGWLTPLMQAFDSDPGLGIVQPKILSRKNRNQFEYAGAAGGHIDRLGIPFCRGRIFGEVETDEGQFSDSDSLFWAGGCCFIVRTDLYKKVGGLDPDFFAHMEEIDLCWRAQRAGFKIGVALESTIYHVGGATLDYSNPRKLFLNYRNNYAMLIKNQPFPALIFTLGIRLALDDIAAIHFLFTRGFGAFWAVLKAQLTFIFNLPMNFRKRSSLAQSLPFIRPKGVFLGSIIMQHFLLRVKKFTDLPKKFS